MAVTNVDKRAGWAREGVRMAIISNRMESIARKMQNTLFRTARSGVLNTAHDFSCVVLTADCELLASAESLPIHTLIGPDIMCRAVKQYHPELKAGDCFLHNSPYEGDSHAADHCLIVPVVDEGGTLRFFVLAKAHQADCGNSRPTTYMGHAKDVYEEGALIFSAAKIQSNYQDNQDLIRMCRARIRVPEQWWGDYLATLGAVRIGERELLQLGREVGWETLEQYATGWFDYSEQKMVEAIRRLPSGKVTVHSAHDPFPGVPDGIPVKVDMTIDSENAKIIVDLTDNIDCQPCGLNLSEGCARTAAMVGIYNGILDHSVPANAGSFRRVDVLLRENCVVGIPRHPHSCSVATTNLADRVSNPVQRAIAEIAPGFGMADTGPIMPPAMGVISGKDPRHGDAPFVNQIFLGATGGAGTPVTDGFLSIIHVGNAGLCRQDSIEVDELHHPLFVRRRSLTPDTEGAGTFRGAPSVYAEFGPTEGCTMEVLYTADGTVNPAEGAQGGGPGALSRAFKRELDGTLTELPACHGVKLEPGEYVVSRSSGGGGYGSPLERDPARVLHDVLEDWVSRERARDVYGVVLVDAGTELAVDEAATARLRASLAN
ncbi:MAG TPA: hydantoinase B/oxoprolinase family protein [Geminicoccus sp.]|uniref:hydantoinase B/oxoprolinase family protein n=1 Tax=Geminicoccus sp. TaxID=2024832 RepID=UPI002BC8E81D|nr:hydantoinase B/oxoprolinase family protein [Geminicoccus sp.]HWL67724.1 hydantoinase B/oxoprolinase family protein [Geminicoccus sp.]